MFQSIFIVYNFEFFFLFFFFFNFFVSDGYRQFFFIFLILLLFLDFHFFFFFFNLIRFVFILFETNLEFATFSLHSIPKSERKKKTQDKIKEINYQTLKSCNH